MLRTIIFGMAILAIALAVGDVQADLVSRWQLDETGGTTAFDSASSNHGTVNGNPVWTTGQIAGGLQFDGNGDYVNVPDNSSLRFSQSSNFTISCWAKPTFTGYMVCKMRTGGISGVFGYQLLWESSVSRFRFIAESSGDGSSSVWTSDNSAPAGTWSHVTVVYSNKSMKIYLNGFLNSSGTFVYDTGTTTPGKDLAIGARSYDSTVTSYFGGVLDDVRIYNTALSDAEVLSLYQVTGDNQASRPSPANNSSNISSNAILIWSPGVSATSHDVYLGTSSSEVSSSTTPVATVDVNSYDPDGLTYDAIYYWRIDEFDGVATHKGSVWNFRVIGGKATVPSPTNGVTSVNLDTTLSWSSQAFIVSHDVYLGTSSSEVGSSTTPVATTTVSSYAPGRLNGATTYYWRIDEYDGSVTVKGDVWHFTTGTPAFPGAEGVGMWSEGGRGGAVYEVTTLADYDPWEGETPIPGSLRSAVSASGPRTVVFRVSGTIHLKNWLYIYNPYITIAGQTAPGDGICIARQPVWVINDHVIIRYIRFRLGDNAAEEGDPAYSGPEGYDSLNVSRGRNIIIDHCSASWSIDESLSVSVPGSWTSAENYFGNVTIQWCVIAESLDCSVHNSPVCHGYGTLAKGGWGNQVTFHHNLYAHHQGRNPYPGNYNDISVDPEGLTFDFRNNVIYNWGGSFAGYNSQAGAQSVVRMNFVGNYYKRGGVSIGNYAFCTYLPSSRGYFSGNWMNTGYPSDPWSLVIDSGGTLAFRLSAPVPVSEQVTMDDAQTAYERVVADAGVTLPFRDAVDQRILRDVINGTGGHIDDETEVGGWPVLESIPAPLDSDHDGMPDEWEIIRGLNPDDSSDGNDDHNGDGYTNLEEYLNYLVARGIITTDFDNDQEVDMVDFAFFANHWFRADCNESNNWCSGTDFNGDGETGLNDLVVLTEDWLEGVIAGTTYYVAKGGNNSNPGTESAPWLTIGKAAATMIAGDSVIVRPGTYAEQISPANSGLKKAPIGFIADGEVIVNASGKSSGFYVDAKSWITIDGFKVISSVDEGICFVQNLASDGIIRNCIITGCGREGIAISDSDRIVIDNCLIYSNTGGGIKTSGVVSEVDITGCTLYGNNKGLSLVGDGMVKDCIITNNATGIYSGTTHIVTYSDVWGNTTNYSGGVSAGAGCISAEPMFVSPGTDFNLLPGSPCIGTGSDGSDMGYEF